MIAIDIHVLLKYNSWSGAADSIYNFINTFYSYLSNPVKVRLLSQAFYLTLIGRFGKVYLPEYDHDGEDKLLESEERVVITIDIP
jgi:hypothetical protein